MTTFMIPSLDRRLLQTVSEEVDAASVHEWPEQSVQLCLDLLRKMRENGIRARQLLEDRLTEGIEARSFAREYSPFLPSLEDYLARVSRPRFVRTSY